LSHLTFGYWAFIYHGCRRFCSYFVLVYFLIGIETSLSPIFSLYKKTLLLFLTVRDSKNSYPFHSLSFPPPPPYISLCSYAFSVLLLFFDSSFLEKSVFPGGFVPKPIFFLLSSLRWGLTFFSSFPRLVRPWCRRVTSLESARLGYQCYTSSLLLLNFH
jgi:hypothetical protein